MLGIIIPAYKRQDCLREALDSLTLQTVKDFEVIVVDDHSPGPLEYCVNEYRNKLNITYFYAEENGGPGAARQIGLNYCYEKNFTYVMFLDSDDLLFPHAVERLLYEIENTQNDFISAAIWQENGPHTGAKIDPTNQTWLHGKIYRISYLRENNIEFPPIRTNEDVTFNLIAMECSSKRGYLDEPLYLFRLQKDSLTKQPNAPMGMVSSDYISSIYYVAKYMKEKFGTITEQILIDIYAVYNFYQVGKALNLITPEVFEHTKYLVLLPEFLSSLTNVDSLNKYIGLANHYSIYEDKIFYFNQTFIGWLSEFGVEFKNENSSN
jgi:glycosyltransferase involved in cell wall biosynthesis